MMGNALVDMYVNCGMLEQAQKVHGELLVMTLLLLFRITHYWVRSTQKEDAK